MAMNEEKIHRDLDRAHLASIGLEQVQERLDAIASSLHIKWEESRAEDAEGREQAWRMLKATRELKRSFMQDINAGRLAQAEIEKNG